MRDIDIDPKLIGVALDYFKKSSGVPLVEMIGQKGWTDVPRVPVFELPREYTHRFVLATDGHARHDAALRLGVVLPCILYAPEEEVIVDGRVRKNCFVISVYAYRVHEGLEK